MRIWVDDIRPAPEGYVWCKSVNETKNVICDSLSQFRQSCQAGEPDNSLFIEEISLDHDAGQYVSNGGDYIKILDWLEWLGGDVINWNFHLHSQNPVGVANMRAIIQRNGWKEI